MHNKRIVFMLLLVTCASVFICGCTGPAATAESNEATGESASLLVYCGAGMREPMDEIGTVFTEKYGTAVNYNFAGSSALLSQMELVKQGDVYMPGATSYFDAAREKGFVEKEELVVYHVPVIVVPKGNPANITCLADLARPGVKVELGDAEACAIGKLCDSLLAKNGIKDEVFANTVARTATVNELIVHTSLGQTDAAIVWEDLYESEKLDLVKIPKEQNIIKIVPIGSLTFSEQKELADQFVAFVSSDEGKAIFTAHGFTTYPDSYYGTV